MPIASGTFGSLWGLPIFYWLSGLGVKLQVLVITGSFLLSVFLAGRAEKFWGKKDPSQVVIDEIVGYMTAMFGLPFSWSMAFFGFFLFRAMDILKPFPIRKIDQQLPGGWGIVLDDVLAGIYCQVIIRIIVYYK
jgi:phosphatidylglycerophosphatase A